MARITPPLEHLRPTTPGAYAEREVLRSLVDGLDHRFHLFHGVNWVVASTGADHHGELDVVVVNDAGDVAVLEVKAGTLTHDGETLRKAYGAESKDVVAQAQRQFGNILHRLKSAGLGERLVHLLVLPDQRIGDIGTISYPRERIADAVDCADLASYMMARLGGGLVDPDRKARVLAFFANQLPQLPDVSQMAGTLRRQVSELSDGLATWVPRIHAPGGVIRVRATAGSGKTQLALRLLRDACVGRQRAAYVCFNRPLADLMRRHAPDPAEVGTFHQLAWQAAGSPTGAQDRAAQELALAAAIEASGPDLDLLVIDELQDLMHDWVGLLTQRLRVSGRLVLLDDPGQCLYTDREEIEVDGAVIVTCEDNHRSPRRIVETINLLGLADRPIHARGPHLGEAPNILAYDPVAADRKADSLPSKTVLAVQNCIDRGHPLQDIVVLCWRGRESSRLMALDRLSDWPLARFTGRYDAQGEPVWTEGDLRIETVRRFKGQSAPAVVLTEVDFDEVTPLTRRMLFVALTRAQMHVEWVMGEPAQGALVQTVGGEPH